ncbi:MAG: helix-turn-helix domain-containing protein [Candidatus Omnitrophica bacterium]|nr:helix-turn-helix domain-containing protein [Candidatus Omnitrophota bacterium]
MPEHLLNIKEVAAYLGVSEEEVKRLVDIGEMPAYKIVDSFLRFRREQVDAVKSEISVFEKEDPNRVGVKLDSKGRPTHPFTELERDFKRDEPAVRQYDYTFAEKIQDFIHYNDFYIASAVIVAALLFIILRS